jgi:hypothetical protein
MSFCPTEMLKPFLFRPKSHLPSRGFSANRKFATYFLMRKLSGRPPLTEGKRIKKIDARFTEEEYKQIEMLELALGLKKTDLVGCGSWVLPPRC